jgi:hypothetical protein
MYSARRRERALDGNAQAATLDEVANDQKKGQLGRPLG